MRRAQDAFNIYFEPLEEDCLIESMLKNNKVELLYDALGHDVPSPVANKKKKKKTATPKVKQTATNDGEPKTIYTLFEYMKEEFMQRLRLDYEEVYATFSERARPLLGEIEEDKERIIEMIDTFVTRMVLSLIMQDKVAVKTRADMIDRLEALYDHRQGKAVTAVKNDFLNYDYVNECISRRCREASDEATDELNIRFSKPKQRGRHPKLKIECVINEIETIASEYIVKRLALSQAILIAQNNQRVLGMAVDSDSSPDRVESPKLTGIDYYPIFQKILETYNRCVPKQTNHGFYIQRLMHFIRVLDSRQWPLHGLMKMVNNMNYFVHAESVKMRFDRTKKRFYCCYSGLEIQNNETVTCLRLVENDAERLKEWRENPISIGKPFEAPEFTRSIAVYYMKKELCCPSTLFYTPFTESYKAHFPDYFANPVVTTAATAAAATTTATHKRVRKPKRKIFKAPLPEEPPCKKPRIVLTEIRCEDECLFDSLAPYAAVEPGTLHYCMSSLLQCVEVTGTWYKMGEQKLKERYTVERSVIHALLNGVTRKSFPAIIRQVIMRTLVIDGEGDDVTECYDALLDFCETLVVGDLKMKISSFGTHQTNEFMRALLHETRRHTKERAIPLITPLYHSLQELVHKEWFKKCPLLFMILFGYMSEHDTLGLLAKPYPQYMNCGWRHC